MNKTFSFVLFPQASEPHMNFNISKMVYSFIICKTVSKLAVIYAPRLGSPCVHQKYVDSSRFRSASSALIIKQ